MRRRQLRFGFGTATHGIGVSAFPLRPERCRGGTDFADTSEGTENTYWSPSKNNKDAQLSATFRRSLEA